MSGDQTVVLDPHIVRLGLHRAMARSTDAVLCIVRPHKVAFVGVSSRRLLVAWEHALGEDGRQASRPVQYYLFPPLIVHMLSGHAAQSVTRMRLGMAAKDVCLTMTDAAGSYELRWRADPASFPAPPEFSKMLAVPEGMLEVSYLHISDAAHQAIANLVMLHSVHDVPPNKLAILIDFSPSHLTLNGQTVMHGIRGRHYFDPRLIIRALEFIKGRTVRVGLNVLPGASRAVLTLLAEQDNWRVHCSLLSIGLDTQKLYPPPET
ncbi:MAG: hypothetical protein JW850_10865 [Thermoflexales bacterium]|nr:hypothetical protein [Thermoflexales bacterium]